MTRRITRAGDDRGSVAVITAISLVPLCLMLALVVDAGRVWAGRVRLQNGVETAAMAAARAWMNGGASCSSTALALVSADGASPTSTTCSVTGTSVGGTVRVSSVERVSFLFAALVKRQSSDVSASTGVKIGAASSIIGLWPFALCSTNQTVSNWIASGMTTATSTAIRFEDQSQKCGGTVTGNWGVLDFNGGSSSNAETKGWVDNGYLGVVSVGDRVQGTPGAPSTSLDMTSAIGRSVILPMFTEPTLTGSNVSYRIVGFAKARVDAVKFTGASASRTISITLQRGTITGSSSSLGGTNFGLVSFGVCSLDQAGSCS